MTFNAGVGARPIYVA